MKLDIEKLVKEMRDDYTLEIGPQSQEPLVRAVLERAQKQLDNSKLTFDDIFERLGEADPKQHYVLLPKRLMCGTMYAANPKKKKPGRVTMALPPEILGESLSDLDKWGMLMLVWLPKATHKHCTHKDADPRMPQNGPCPYHDNMTEEEMRKELEK